MNRNWQDILIFHELNVEEKHICDHNKDIDIAVINCYSAIDKKKHWVVVQVWIAGEEEVSDGEADEVGEVKQVSVLRIKFCPFCGERLEAQ